jgi:glycine/D-amino acid oxidase-like deaminating enzyme
MESTCHTVVLGGGCLGAASAVAIQRRLRAQGSDGKVLLVDKSVLGAGLSARHSGIVRAANADQAAATLANRAITLWRKLEPYWGVDLRTENPGAVWIARADPSGDNPRWRSLQAGMEAAGVAFSRVNGARARELCGPHVRLDDNEVFYHEPDALQLDPAEVRATLYQALAANDIAVREKTAAQGFERAADGRLCAVLTHEGRIGCEHVVNACGPWSPSVFASLGLQIPVSVETVAVINWMLSRRDLPGPMPIIADYSNLAYFRLWSDGAIHMHQPRKRSPRETARAFAENPLAMMGADFVTDPANQTLSYAQIRVYEDIVRRRFGALEPMVFGSGYRSYFDITPDLKFILGPDPRVPNLVHCLGAGQSLKYAPVFGEAMADFVAGGGETAKLVEGFSIARFDENYMSAFWAQVAGRHHSLAVEEGGL